MKILYHHRTFGKWPEGIHIKEIINAFEKLGHRVILSDIQSNNTLLISDNSLLRYLKRNLPFFLVEFGELFFNIITFFKLKKLIKKEKPDFIYYRYALFEFSPILLSRKYNIPLILEVNAPMVHKQKLNYKFLFYRLAQKIESFVYRNAVAILVVSNFLKNILIKEGVPKSKITVLYNAANLYDRKIKPKKLKSKRIYVGYVGSVSKDYGLLDFFKLIKSNFKEDSKVNFLIVGDGDAKNKFQTYIDNTHLCNFVNIAGEVDHYTALQYIKSCDICLLIDSKKMYGSPMKLFEYMNFGKAILAADLPFVKEVIIHGKNGYLFKTGNYQQLLKYLLLLIKNKSLRARVGKNAQETITKKGFTWEENARRIIELYDKTK